ncbi:alpha/beta fold hydrolase [Aquimarina gracilis]
MKRMLIIIGIMLFNMLSGQNTSFEKTTSFYPNSKTLKNDNIIWGYLTVPEDWNNPKSNKIKIAVSVLKNTSNRDSNNAVVFIQGGPGAKGVDNMGFWRKHDLRQNNDIVLFDIRGTGFSKPRLCPDLGKTFLDILAKNQSAEEDEKQKAIAALSCKKDLQDREVDINAYHSFSVAKDLHALKQQLGYRIWNVYGVSYGTYMAQVYASEYPNDIKAMLLDSSINDITSYYTKNTTNYINSLLKVFKKCSNDEECNEEYPNLESVYYKVIESLEKTPITVSVDKKIVDSGTFTYNSEDFKIAIQQALYHKKLIEIVPLLIYQFQNRNEKALGNLVAAFSSLLSMDYGVYYCVSCTETLPVNNRIEYNEDAKSYKGLNGGVSFYKSDFKVCEKWNLNNGNSLQKLDYSSLSSVSFPVLILAGEYDPITPMENGEKTANNFYNSYYVPAPSLGHVPSFTKEGALVAKTFINKPYQQPNSEAFANNSEVSFVKDVFINSGVSNIGNSLSEFNLIFLSPLFIALLLMTIFVVTYIIKLLRKKYKSTPDKIIRISSLLTSIFGITGLIFIVLALIKVAGQNYFILAFGLPNDFNYIFTLFMIFTVLLTITLLYFIIQIRRIKDRSIVFSLIFSNVLLMTYLFYWGVF